jgi:hypothetical protein
MTETVKARKDRKRANHAVRSFRKWKKNEAAKKQAETDRNNNLCGPVTITYISK